VVDELGVDELVDRIEVPLVEQLVEDSPGDALVLLGHQITLLPGRRLEGVIAEPVSVQSERITATVRTPQLY
jgi:hypothetical protein